MKMIEIKIETTGTHLLNAILFECDYEETRDLLNRFLTAYVELYFHENTIRADLEEIKSIIEEAEEEFIPPL